MMRPRPTNLPLYSCFDVQLPPYATGPISAADPAKTPRRTFVSGFSERALCPQAGSKAVVCAPTRGWTPAAALGTAFYRTVRAERLVAHTIAPVTEHIIFYRHKLPVVSVGLQVEPDHTIGLGAADFAVRLRVLEGVQALAPRPHYELA